MKRMSCLTVVALLSVCSLGCPSKRDAGDARDAAGKGPAARSTEDRMRAFYPAVLGTFYRTEVTRHDEAGENAAVSYRLAGDRDETLITFTAFVYPADEGATLDDAVKSATGEFRSAHRGAKVVSTEPTQTQQGGQVYAGKKVTFNYEGTFGTDQRRPLVSELYVFKKGDRLVKYLVTYPAADAAFAQQRMIGFVRAFPWPSTI